MWEGHVEDVGEATGTNNVIVIEEMAAFRVGIDGHVLLDARERTATSVHARSCETEASRGHRGGQGGLGEGLSVLKTES